MQHRQTSNKKKAAGKTFMNISSNHWQLSLTLVSGWVKEELIITGNLLKHSPAEQSRVIWKKIFTKWITPVYICGRTWWDFELIFQFLRIMEHFFILFFCQRFDSQKSCFPARTFALPASKQPNHLCFCTSDAPVPSDDCQHTVPENLKCSDGISRSVSVCGVCVCGCVFWFALQSSMAEAAGGPGLTAVVLNRDVVGQQLVLAAHTDEQRTSSPVWRMEEGSREQMTVWRGLTGSDIFMGRFRMNEWDPVNPGWPLRFFLIALLETLTSNLYGW